ncbi:hypothetical protein DICPUDRAFT_77261 [Dictyostelium purpureum]|uniref:Uncharacterized protein n=1 Tax=Dictyostelium purpureum TaxID=5786 RepID=F0ZG36_DICPU|nr:uncharacterized protein DICPUDRAFT_77261 [Dictyostelium purpureum]EGC37110.1 hypothetical protein DICPUDRAFT_77261 [Dictyostelium purpureum]|eukprot:XP_003286391.1 hypothetical protein DICPUDRAFT_77261 [Dictyostelium purpureum]
MLNYFIFKKIIPYLIYKKPFIEILNISLLSKQCFTFIQNNIPFYTEFEYTTFLDSIIKNHDQIIRDNNKYKSLLFQYNNFQIIKFNKIPIYLNLASSYQDLKKYFKELEQVFFNDYCYSDEENISINEYDPTFNNFFFFKKIIINSEDNETFDFFKKFNFAKVVKFQKSYKGSNKIDGVNILKYESIESIKFKDLISPFSFLKEALIRPNLKKLTIFIEKNDKVDFNEIFDGISRESSNIRKLLLFSPFNPDFVSKEDEIIQINILFNLLKLNKSIREFSLPYFQRIDDPKIYEPLISIGNINTLHIDLSMKWNLQIFQHILINPNIVQIYIYFIGLYFLGNIIQFLEILRIKKKNLTIVFKPKIKNDSINILYKLKDKYKNLEIKIK